MNKNALMPKTKLIALLILAILAIVLVLQNTQGVATRLLFTTVSMPLAVLLILMLLIGFATGVLIASRIGNQHARQPLETK